MNLLSGVKPSGVMEEALGSGIANVVTDKENGLFSMTPGVVLGAVFGANIASKNVQKQGEKKIQEELNKFRNARPVLEGDYYKQVRNISENLEVVFTPISVIYMLNDKNRKVAIDTIDSSRMSSEFKERFLNKDANFFRNLMLAKMHSEVQMAENYFARRILENFSELKGMNKIASIQPDESFLLNLERIRNLDITLKNSSERENIFGYLNSKIAGEEFECSLNISDDIEKYAGFDGSILSSIGLLNPEVMRNTKAKLTSDNYIKNNIRIAFLPDRVLFLVDDTLINTLHTRDMNEEGFEAFSKSNKKYFKGLLKNELKLAKVANDEFIVSDMFKESVSNDNRLAEIFVLDDIHPVIYQTVLTEKYSEDWVEYDPQVLIKVIEQDFYLQNGISDSALNKILCIQLANKDVSCYVNSHVFEKIVRAFSNKSIDFKVRESDNVNILDIAFCIDVLDRVTPDDDIYDNFSESVASYIVDVCIKSNMKVYSVEKICGSIKEPEFSKAINNYLLREINSRESSRVDDIEFYNAIKKTNDRIHDTSLSVINSVQRILKDTPHVSYGEAVGASISDLRVPLDIMIMVKEQVYISISINENLQRKEVALKKQLENYNLLNLKGVELIDE